MKTVELKLLNVKEEHPMNADEGRMVIIFVGNIDNRGFTKSKVGYFKGGNWYSMHNLVVKNVTHFAFLPEPMDDGELM